MPTPLREAALAAIAAQLAAALPSVPVERNRRAMPDLVHEALPRLALLDGDHQVPGSDAFGTVLYRVQAMVVGHVSAATDAALGAALNDLHAAVVAAICNQEILVAGEQNIWPQEEGMQLIPFAAEESSRPFMGFVLTIAFDLRVPDATGPYTTT
jgi:hypothetical protein